MSDGGKNEPDSPSLEDMTKEELEDLAEQHGVEDYGDMSKEELVDALKAVEEIGY